MPLFEIRNDTLAALTATTFSKEGIKERQHLQRMLRDQIDVIGDGLLVIAEEFGNWEDSQRRIDLLAVDRQANLFVIELKRTVTSALTKPKIRFLDPAIDSVAFAPVLHRGSPK